MPGNLAVVIHGMRRSRAGGASKADRAALRQRRTVAMTQDPDPADPVPERDTPPPPSPETEHIEDEGEPLGANFA